MRPVGIASSMATCVYDTGTDTTSSAAGGEPVSIIGEGTCWFRRCLSPKTINDIFRIV